MGKKVKLDLDLVELPENGTEPKLDLVAIEEPVKKKDPTTSDPSLESGTTTPGSVDSSQPATKPVSPEPKPSKEPTPEEEDSWFEKISDFFASIPKAAVTSAYNVIANQIPQEFKTEDLRLSGGTLESYLNPSRREGEGNVQSSGFEFPEGDKLRAEYGQWINKQPSEVRSLKNDDRARKFIEETIGVPKSIELKKKFNAQLSDYRLKLESQVSEQKKDSEKLMKGIPQSVRDVESVQDGAELAAKFIGEGVGRIATSVATGGGGSIIAERAAVFDRQLDQMAEIAAKKTGVEPDIARRMILKYQQDKPEEGRVIGDLAALLDIVSIPAASGKLGKTIGLVTEGATETGQSELEEVGATLGSGADYEYDPVRSVDSFLGGFLGAKGVQMIMPGGKEPAKPLEQTIKEESAALSSDNIEGIEKAAENIEAADNPIDAVKIDDKPTTADQPIVEPPPTKTVAPPVKEQPKPKPVSEAEQVARQYNEEVNNPTNMSGVEAAIGEELGKVNKESFNRYSDPNKITTGMAKSYFKKGGEDIDQVAQRVSYSLYPDGDGTEVSPEDITNYIERFPSGVASAYTPAGNPKLFELSQKYTDLTGKTINRRTAKSISDSIVESLGNEQANSHFDKFIDEEGNLKREDIIAEIERDPEFQKNNGLSDEDFGILKQQLNEQESAVRQTDSQSDQRGQDQAGAQPSQGGPISFEFRDKTKDPQKSAEEVKNKPLTHVKGLDMGKGVSAGTYVSTEEQNRYGEGEKVTVDVKAPFEFKSEDLIIPFRNKILNDNFDQFSEEDFDGDIDPFADKNIEQLSFKGIDKLAELVRKNLQEEGYDSIYLPETETQEGELIVFDPKNVQFEKDVKDEKSAKPGKAAKADVSTDKPEQKDNIEKQRKKELFNASKPRIELPFITDEKVVTKTIKETVVDEDGNTATREITVGKRQAEIKKQFNKLRDLIDCVYGK